MTNLVKLQHWVAAAFAIVTLCVTDVAAAQNYPKRVIKIIVPFGPGGQPDVIARVFAQHLAATVGATVIDNRAGANTTIGSKAAAAAEPDGYTLLFGSSTSLAIAPALSANVGYDPIRSFTPIVGISSSPMHFAVGPSVPAKTVAEFLAYARANPGKLNFAAPTGGPPHLAGEIFKRATNIDITPIHYRQHEPGDYRRAGRTDGHRVRRARAIGAVASGRQVKGAGVAWQQAHAGTGRRADDGGERTA